MIRRTLFETINMIDVAVLRLKEFEPEEGYYLAFSGGKDSCVIKALADIAGVKYDAHYNMTTIDPPELVQFIREFHSDVQIHKPERSFFQEMQKRGFPTRRSRWCCEVLKEHGGEHRFVITGVRWAESQKRAGRRLLETCYKDSLKHYLNVIVDWTDADVWEFIKSNKVPYCKLYDEGFKRIGCLLCPVSGSHRQVEADRYPKMTKAFILNFEKLYESRKSAGADSVKRWKSGAEMFSWWMDYNRQAEIPDQGVLFE